MCVSVNCKKVDLNCVLVFIFLFSVRLYLVCYVQKQEGIKIGSKITFLLHILVTQRHTQEEGGWSTDENGGISLHCQVYFYISFLNNKRPVDPTKRKEGTIITLRFVVDK